MAPPVKANVSLKVKDSPVNKHFPERKMADETSDMIYSNVTLLQ